MHLDLSNNEIEYIDELPDLTDLVFVNFTANAIRDIHYDAFDRKSSRHFPYIKLSMKLDKINY